MIQMPNFKLRFWAEDLATFLSRTVSDNLLFILPLCGQKLFLKKAVSIVMAVTAQKAQRTALNKIRGQRKGYEKRPQLITDLIIIN